MIVLGCIATYLAFWFLWTTAEYFMHRFSMHALRGKGLASKAHLTHHARRDSVLEYWPISWSGVIGVGVAIGINLAKVAPLPIALAGAAGWIGGYGFYDWIHFRAHRRTYFAWAPMARYEHWVRRNHFHHHFGHPNHNHGVTHGLFDMLFGTHDVVTGPVAVPRRLAMVWLTDESGELRPEHAADFQLVGRTEPTEEQLAADRVAAFANLAPSI